MEEQRVQPDRGRHYGWDFALVTATVAFLGALGVQSLAGTLYAWWAGRTVLDWDAVGYPGFVSAMNAVALPLVIALVVVMGLCVPKRLFAHRALAAVSAALVALGLAWWALTGSASAGLGVYLLGAAGIQLAVTLMTLAGAPSLRYLSEGRLTKVGSGLLHLGFVVFGWVVMSLQSSPRMLPAFWVSFALCVGGSGLCFYADDLARMARGERRTSGA